MNDAGGSARRVAGLALDALSLAAIWCECVPRDDVGFAESVGAGWRDTGDGTKTMLCQSRLAYVFTHAGLLGNRECGALGAVSVERMNRLFWRSDARGWVRAIDTLGRCTDLRIDSYDQAFGLLALAWQFRATAAPEFRAVALAALAGLDTAAADAGIEGYPEWRDIQGKAASTAINGTAFRRQNTHMHLLEAFLAWSLSDPAGPWLERARSMVGLFRERFVATRDTGLAEYFDARLRTAPGADGAVREPGHHFEWIWLLKRWQEASDDRQAAADAERLWRIACATGVDVDEFAFDVVDAEGRTVADTKLLWPQTELLKARCARFESTGDESQREGAARTLTGLDTYFAGAEPGLWHNQLDRSRRPLAVPTLSRVLYHLFVALAETRRVFGDTPAR